VNEAGPPSSVPVRMTKRAASQATAAATLHLLPLLHQVACCRSLTVGDEIKVEGVRQLALRRYGRRCEQLCGGRSQEMAASWMVA
jgi:hypothetical protein